MSVIGPGQIIDKADGERIELDLKTGAEAYFEKIKEKVAVKGDDPGKFAFWKTTILTEEGKVLVFDPGKHTFYTESRFGNFGLSAFPGPNGILQGVRPVGRESQGASVNIYGYDKHGEPHLLLIREMRQSLVETEGVIAVPDVAERYKHVQEWHPPMGFSTPDSGNVSAKLVSITDTVKTEACEETGLRADSFIIKDNLNSLPICMNASSFATHNSNVVFAELSVPIEDMNFNPKADELVTGFKWFSLEELYQLSSSRVYDDVLFRSGPAMGAVLIFISKLNLGEL